MTLQSLCMPYSEDTEWILTLAHDHGRSSEIVLGSGRIVQAHVVLLTAGIRPTTALASQVGLDFNTVGVTTNRHMQTSGPDIYAVGDMACTVHRITKTQHNPALADPASRQGRFVADHIFGRGATYRVNVGIVVCQVFDLEIGTVGSSIGRLQAQGLEPEHVTVHPTCHVSYYPGNSLIKLKPAFLKPEGKIIGAQVVGKKGVDKRIDVIATCLQSDLTVFDLEHLKLAYAPPFGSAKDPVNVSGFVASNVLRINMEIIHPENLTSERLESLQVVNVRTIEEFAHGTLKVPC